MNEPQMPPIGPIAEFIDLPGGVTMVVDVSGADLRLRDLRQQLASLDQQEQPRG